MAEAVGIHLGKILKLNYKFGDRKAEIQSPVQSMRKIYLCVHLVGTHGGSVWGLAMGIPRLANSYCRVLRKHMASIKKPYKRGGLNEAEVTRG